MSYKSFVYKTVPNCFYKNNKIHLVEYSNLLSQHVKEQPGLILHEQFWLSADINATTSSLLCITTWKDEIFWKEWYESQQRQQIKKEYKDLSKKEKIFKSQKKIFTDEIFLL